MNQSRRFGATGFRGVRVASCGIRSDLPRNRICLHSTFSSSSRRRISSTAPTYKVKVQYAQSVFQDPTLAWAQQNPQLAQECLNPPRDDVECSANFDADKSTSLEGYLKWRQWELPGQLKRDDGDDTESAVALISHVLSAPLTLASQFGSLTSGNESDNIPQSTQKWCCIGARAEATLPAIYWNEFLMLGKAQLDNKDDSSSNDNTPQPLDMTLLFTGPDIPPKFPNQTVTATSSASITLQGGFRGLYHENPTANEQSFDGFVLFNPGCAHPNHVKDWETTLSKILEQAHSKPDTIMLITAHSAKDAERDFNLLKDKFGLDLEYRENPFASRVCYQDPFDPAHLVRPNHFVATWSSS